jgi:hypothetical protein
VRLTVKQLLGRATLADRVCRASEDGTEKFSVAVGERRGAVATRHKLLRLGDSICEMWRHDIELAHSGMQPLERIRVVAR